MGSLSIRHSFHEMGSSALFFRQKLVSFFHSVFTYLLPLFSFIFSSLKKNDEKIINFPEEKAVLCKAEELDFTEFRDFDNDSNEEEKEEEVYLKFKFPSFEEFIKIQKGTDDGAFNESDEVVVPSGKNEFTSGKSLIVAFIEDINVENKEDFSDSPEKGKEVMTFDAEEEKNEKSEEIEEKQSVHDEEFEGKQECSEAETKQFCEKSSMTAESDTESTSFEHIRSVMTSLVDSYSADGFLSDGDFESSGFEQDQESLDELLSDVESDVMEEVKRMEEECSNDSKDPCGRGQGFLSEKDFNEDSEKVNELGAEFGNVDHGDDGSEKMMSKDECSGDALWEHQELIDQLKMELKKVRATGLPTILEESESPKIMDDLKPWKIDDKFHREDCMGELHKFYKSYREKMRKFDILNYQKMYAMGFLQLKDPLQSMSSNQRASAPSLKSLVSQNLWLFKHRVHGSDPMKKFIKELEGDLEVVYVGQLCLSWEFLHWQYEKALDLWDSDPRGIRRFNEVAGEFQQFQVLVQRFIEDELFQGPRVQNYVKNRCVLRNLLQVPVIREDNLKDKKKDRNRYIDDEYVITSDTLVEIVEESIRIFWQFVRADKDCASSAATNSNKKMPELQSPDDLKLLLEAKKVLQKKERKVKELLRSENCILRKFRRSRDDDSDQVLYFFSQVDMKLVARVLNMSKVTTDQLVWCHSKLSRISFVNRKIRVDPAFLPFPC